MEKAKANENNNVTVYLTVDNYSRAFKVIINGLYVTIKNNKIIDNTLYSDVDVLDIMCNKIFIGKSPVNKMTKYSECYGSLYNGNSILLHVKDNEYIFIGDKVFSFSALTEITKYVSPVGNNEVPYPYAVDKDKNIYLLAYNTIIKYSPQYDHNFDHPLYEIYDELLYKDIYEQLYERYQNDPQNNDYDKLGSDPYDYYQNCCKITNIQNIDKFYINNNELDLRYTKSPEELYNWYTQTNKVLYILKTDGIKQILSKEDYINIIKEYGCMKSFYPLNVLHTYANRQI